MISRNDIADALTKCVGYDPTHMPKPSEIILDAWCEHFALYPHLIRYDLLTAVTHYYRRPAQPVPQPADISAIARDLHRDMAQRWRGCETEPYEQIVARETGDTTTELEARR